MGGIFEDINEGGITMAFLYLNDWSMKGTGTLTSQWQKVERWYELMTHLSDTYGIAKLVFLMISKEGTMWLRPFTLLHPGQYPVVYGQEATFVGNIRFSHTKCRL